MFSRIKCLLGEHRIKFHSLPIEWDEWALPLEVYTIQRGFAIRVFVFEIALSLECKHKWRDYHRNCLDYRANWSGGIRVKKLTPIRKCIRCGKRETVAEPKDIHEAMSQAIKVNPTLTATVLDEWQEKPFKES